MNFETPATNPSVFATSHMHEVIPQEDLSSVVERAQQGDVEAFRSLFRAYRGQVTRILLRVLGPNEELEDVVQEVFVSVHRALPSFRGDAKFTTWLYRVSVNVARMHLRKKKSRPRLVGLGAENYDVPTMNTPVDDINRQRRIEALYRAVDKLSEKKREVLVLHDFQGMATNDIADVISIPVATVRTRLFHARQEIYAHFHLEPELAEVRELVAKRRKGPRRQSESKATTETNNDTASQHEQSRHDQRRVTP